MCERELPFVLSKEGRSEAISSETGNGVAFASILRGIIYLSIAAMSKAALHELEDLIWSTAAKVFFIFKFKFGDDMDIMAGVNSAEHDIGQSVRGCGGSEESVRSHLGQTKCINRMFWLATYQSILFFHSFPYWQHQPYNFYIGCRCNSMGAQVDLQSRILRPSLYGGRECNWHDIQHMFLLIKAQRKFPRIWCTCIYSSHIFWVRWFFEAMVSTTWVTIW